MAYTINFSEPTKTSFTINDNAFDGPGGSAQSSTLRLYGRGALEWGESVDEDLLRSLESYASATPPSPAVEGQLWFGVALYWFNSALSSWYRWDYPAGTPNSNSQAPLNANGVGSTLANGSWVSISPTLGITSYGSLQAITGTIGQYAYVSDSPGTTIRQLYRWDIPYAEAAPQWMPRLYRTETTVPVTGSNYPTGALFVYNPYTLSQTVGPAAPSVIASGNMPTLNGWMDVSAVRVQQAAPLNPTLGQMYLNTGTTPHVLYVFNGTAFEQVNLAANDARYVLKAGDTMTGSLILNADPTTSLMAATKNYVDTTVINAPYVHRAGDTMTGTLTLLGPPLSGSNQAATAAYVDLKVAKNGDTMTGPLYLNGDPTTNLQAATKHYVDNNVTFTLPIKSIIMWTGDITLGGSNFDPTGKGIGPNFVGAGGPATWVLCDAVGAANYGSYGVINLSDRFIIGAGGAIPATGLTGGSTTTLAAVTGITANAVTISGNTTPVALSIAQIPGHTHTVTATVHPNGETGPSATPGFTDGSGISGNYTVTSGSTGTTGGTHYHPFSGTSSVTVNDPTHFHSHPAPPYVALAFIMRIS